VFFLFSGRNLYRLYHFASWLIRLNMPLRHGLSRVPAFASIALRQPPAAALPIPRMSPEKIHPWIFSGLQKRFALLHVAKSPSMALYWLASTSEKSLRGFFRDCRIATQFCMRKAALRGSLLVGKYEAKIPPWIF
jgi:hypothetical protein